MKITENFSLEEFEVSETAARRGLDNSVPASLVPNITSVACLLEKVRSAIGVPITITSGYRSPEVNKLVGGVPDSQHVKGLAADIIAPRYGRPYVVAQSIIAAKIPYDQLIVEFGRWVHISAPAPGKVPRGEVLTYLKPGQPPVAGLA